MQPEGMAGFERLIGEALVKVNHLQPRPRSFRQTGRRKRTLDATLLSMAAKRLGLWRLKLSGDAQVIGDAQQRIGFFQNMPWSLTALDRFVTHDKELTKRILSAHGIPVARGAVFDNLDEAVEYFRALDAPAVVKPITGSGGKGVSVGVHTVPQVVAAVNAVLDRGRRVLIEECLTSIDLRVMVVRGKAIAAMLRVPAHVTGDGSSTVSELIAQKNSVRKANAYLKHAPIRMTADVVERLADQGITLDSVVPAGQRYFLHYKANLSAGGDSFDVTEVVHPDILRLAERAVGCFPTAGHAGVDLLLERYDEPLSGQRCVVCEINCNNDMPLHEFPLFGKPVNVARLELEGYFGSPSMLERLRGRIGTAGRVVSARGMAHHPPGMDHISGIAGACQSLLEWTELWRKSDQPCRPPDLAESDSPRKIDEVCLLPALSEHCGKVQGHGRLLRGWDDNSEIILERSGGSVFAREVAKRQDILHNLLTASGIASCRARRFEPSHLPEAIRFFQSASGPWNLRVTISRGRARVIYSVTSTAELEEAWSRHAEQARYLTLEQAGSELTLALLLVGDTLAGSVVLVPENVVGDGVLSAATLLERRRAARAQHPLLRHYPARSNTTEARRGTGEEVPTANQRLLLSSSPYLASGADTIGFAGSPVPELLGTALQVRELIGGAPLLAVTFALRPPETRGSEAHWAVATVDSDPILAHFAWPWAGEAGGDDVYRAVAEELASGQRYRLIPQ